jgi:hypothetical protein
MMALNRASAPSFTGNPALMSIYQAMAQRINPSHLFGASPKRFDESKL